MYECKELQSACDHSNTIRFKELFVDLNLAHDYLDGYSIESLSLRKIKVE